MLQVLHFVGGLRGIDHLEEGDGVRGDAGVVLGDHVLLRNFEDGLLHRHAPADAVGDGDDDGEAGGEGARVAAEALDRPLLALRHKLDRGGDDEERQNEHRDDENREGVHDHEVSPGKVSGPAAAPSI